MYTSCLEKQQAVKTLFAPCQDMEAKYRLLIDLGRQQKQLAADKKTADNIVRGCQSTVYLHTQMVDGSLVFEAESDALISAGLAMLLVKVYSGESPEAILKCPPTYLEEIGINNALTPSRANGLHHIHLRMKQEAIKVLAAAAFESRECTGSHQGLARS
jgi:cysteine desulfuration protein SufE